MTTAEPSIALDQGTPLGSPSTGTGAETTPSHDPALPMSYRQAKYWAASQRRMGGVHSHIQPIYHVAPGCWGIMGDQITAPPGGGAVAPPVEGALA